MINIIEGKPGSGKTYWVVSYLLNLFYEWREEYFTWFPKSGDKKIFTNVTGLKTGDVRDINREVKSKGSLREFFKVDLETGELLNEDLRNSIIIIDEAQSPKWFHRKFSDAVVMYFFQMHRHYGCEIFLCTQSVKSMCVEIRELPEYYIKAARASYHLAGRFRYQKYYDDEPGARSFLKKDQRVFDMYKSVDLGAEMKKPALALTRYIVIFGLGVAVFIGGLYLLKNTFFGGGSAIAKTRDVHDVGSKKVDKHNKKQKIRTVEKIDNLKESVERVEVVYKSVEPKSTSAGVVSVEGKSSGCRESGRIDNGEGAWIVLNDCGNYTEVKLNDEIVSQVRNRGVFSQGFAGKGTEHTPRTVMYAP